MPNRILNEKIRTSKQINAMNDFQFRLWTYLLTYVDDYGRGSADTQLLKGFVFPRRNVREQDIQGGLEALERNGSILLYTVAGEPYLCFPTWQKYQRVQTKISKFPEPGEEDMSRWLTVNHGDSPPESNPIQNPESNPESRNNAPARHRHGSYGLVLLSDADLEKLKAEFPGDYMERIGKLDSYMASTGKSYKNHLATIRNWAMREKQDKGSKSGNVFMDIAREEGLL